MNKLLRFALATALVTAVAAPAAAGELRLSMGNGRVTLVAKDVTVREILNEWARVGQTRIVNGEKLTGGPVTLELTDVPEAQAIDAILRSAAGYVMAPRLAGSPGSSHYDRIMILASSRPPVVTASNPAPFTSRPMPQVPQAPQHNPAEDDVEFGPTGANMINGPIAAQPGVAVMPQPTMPGVPPQQMQPGQQGQQPAQVPMTAPRPGQLPAPVTNGPVVPPNPFLGAPPGPAAPTFNPNPPPPPTTPRGPGGPGGV